MRADRLVAIVLLLQAHGQLTAGQLSEMLETSERTIRRDLDALCMAGVPLYSQRGRGGGWALLGGHRLDLTGLTIEEAQALFLVAGGRSSQGDRPSDPILQAALRKVLMALPEPMREHATTAARVSVVDPAGWGGTADDPPFLAALRAAVMASVQVDILYTKPGHAPERRRVHPYGLVDKRGVWYLLAGTSEGRRTFRASRVQGVEPTDEPCQMPEGFDLAKEWASAQADLRQRIHVAEVQVEVAPRSVLALAAALRGWSSMEEQPACTLGWRAFVLRMPSWRAAARELVAFGADVRVVAPAEVRDELLRIGQELVSSYG